VEWTFSIEPGQEDTTIVVMTADIAPGWYVYSQYLGSDEGPIATKITFDEAERISWIGQPEESGTLVDGFDEIFGMQIRKYKHKMQIRQRFLLPKGAQQISGTVLFMCCDHEQCLPPREVEFSLDLP
jgi:thiol:disulfide interchange protein DsbD